jgi:hypothetical protein
MAPSSFSMRTRSSWCGERPTNDRHYSRDRAAAGLDQERALPELGDPPWSPPGPGPNPAPPVPHMLHPDDRGQLLVGRAHSRPAVGRADERALHDRAHLVRPGGALSPPDLLRCGLDRLQSAHMRRTTQVVAAPMLAELNGASSWPHCCVHDHHRCSVFPSSTPNQHPFAVDISPNWSAATSLTRSPAS